ncbi:MAG: BrnT family toxin [Rickettsiales bacterium]|jgi:uncharacterized DUF497 family protein|nr:BrnT family toxin [Rickettsiales bacterium]
MFEWDKTKQQKNLAKHGVDFECVWEMDWLNAAFTPDGRKEYGELRIVAFLPYGKRLYTCIYTQRGENKRIISLRKSNEKEEVRYEQKLDDEGR